MKNILNKKAYVLLLQSKEYKNKFIIIIMIGTTNRDEPEDLQNFLYIFMTNFQKKLF